jgi:hypothetical protein
MEKCATPNPVRGVSTKGGSGRPRTRLGDVDILQMKQRLKT